MHVNLSRTIKRSELPEPSTLYKFMTKHWASELMKFGTVQVGTLHDYRNMEKHGKRGDADEGKLKYVENVGAATTLDKLSHIAKSLIHDPHGVGAHVTISDVNFTNRIDHPDCLVYCTSTSDDPSTDGGLDEYDACVKIVDPPRFFEAITMGLGRMTDSLQGHMARGLVTYQERTLGPSDRKRHPALVKPPRFADDREYRAVWFVEGVPVKVTPIKRTDVARYCVRLY
jgi:hypothetical protein